MSTKKSNLLNRPLTPHLTIYSGQFTSLFSIWHRITGLFLCLSFILFISIIKFVFYFPYGLTFQFLFPLWIQNSFYIIITLFFLYHMLNGIRHIIWDLGFILIIEKILVSSILINFVLCVYSLYLIFKIWI